MADYSRFANSTEEWEEHIAKYGKAPEVPVGQMSAQEIQRTVNSGREQLAEQQMIDEDLASKVDIQTINITARDNFLIPTRIYSPKTTSTSRSALPIYIFYHGGGFVFGTLDAEDPGCCRIVASMSIIVISISYRHTPKYPFPAAHHDALDAFDWVIDNADFLRCDLGNIIVGGVSAGANLAAHVCLERCVVLAKEREEYEKACIKGLVLAIPWLVVNAEKVPYEGFKEGKHSRVQCADAPVIPQEVVRFFVDCMGGKVGVRGRVDPDVGVVEGEKLRTLPSTAVLVAGNDPVRDDGVAFAKKLKGNGIPVKAHVFPGLPHGFRRFDDLKSSRRYDELVVESIKWSLAGPSATSGSDLEIEVE